MALSYRLKDGVVHQRRIAKGLTLRALADACEKAGQRVSDSQLSKIERGKYSPRPAALKALVDVLGLDLEVDAQFESSTA
ncbi:helix-turn-helix domain-containing protein [Lentzea sp. NPDC059081]|uniref:helix-turn-helix domain-containing protein n=1 Tax=Lentzea sp. NPDC059081 TaxID=3346719 RepID=UPI0036AFA4E9